MGLRQIYRNIAGSGVRSEKIFDVDSPPPPREPSEHRVEDIQAQIMLEKDPVLKAQLVETYSEVMKEARDAGKGEKKG